jgi:RNA polymerase sigma factor (sigma-70 family)
MPKQQFIDDQELVQQYTTGNDSALETLIHRHKKRLFTYIFMIVRDRDLSEDIFQDTFMKVVSTLRKGHYNEEGKFLPWIQRIAHNLIIDHFRKDKRMPTISGGTNEDGEEYSIFDIIKIREGNVEDKLVKKQVYKDLRKLVDMLPMEQKEVLMMRHYYDMSFKEISEQTNVSINTALGRMRYALINLRKLAEQNNIALSM